MIFNLYFWAHIKIHHMKIDLRLIIVLFAIPAILTGQPFSGGIKSGLVASQVAGDTYSGYNKAGIDAGVFINLETSRKVSINMEIAFVQKGSRNNENPDVPSSGQYLLRLNYVELPLVLQYKISPFKIEAGISADFLLNYFEESNYQYIELNEWRSVALNSIFGIQYQLNDKWAVGIRSINSTSSIRKNAIPGNVRRYGNRFGQFNDALVINLYYTILPSNKP